MKNNLNAKYYYALQVPSDVNDPHERPQYYFATNIFGLFYNIVAHRIWHWRNGDGWKD